MGLAFFNEIGARVAPSVSTAPVVGGPWFGQPYFPQHIDTDSVPRVRFQPDLGGIPLHRGALFGIGGANATNHIANPRFMDGDTGWDIWGVAACGGMFGGGRCGIARDDNVGAEALDAFYTWDKGSAIGTTGVFFGIWVRAVLEPFDTVTSNWVSIKLVVQDGVGSTVATSPAFQRVYSSQGWTWCQLVVSSRAWTGNELKAGIMFANPGDLNTRPMFLDGAILSTGHDSTHPMALPYYDGDHGGAEWDGSTDQSETLVEDARYLQWSLKDVPLSRREGYISCLAFPAFSPSDNAYASSPSVGFTGYRLLEVSSNIGSGFSPYVNIKKRVAGDGYTVEARVGSGSFSLISFDLVGWPPCALHIVLSWSDRHTILGIRGYFNAALFGLSSNIAVKIDDPDRLNFPAMTPDYITLGAEPDGSRTFSGHIRDLCIGNRGLSPQEVDGVLKHGPGPYTGTVAWAPLDSGLALFLVEAVSFHSGGALGVARGSYAPDSGLVPVAGAGRPAADLTRAVTENVVDSFGLVGRLGDVQLTHRAISDLSKLFEQTHRNNEQGARYSSGVVYSLDTLQQPHPTLRTFPIPKPLRSYLVWGDIQLDPRLSSYYGQQGRIWGGVRFERWGFWQDSATRVPLAKDHEADVAMSYATRNFNTVAFPGVDSSDQHYFEIPEGILEGDQESPCQVFIRDPPNSNLARIRMARRSRGIPGDVLACYEAEDARNTISFGDPDVDANASGGGYISYTDPSDSFADWIKFQVVDQDAALPDWIFGEFRLLVVVSAQVGAIDPFFLRARVDMGGGYQGPYGPEVGIGSTSSTLWRILDLGIFKLPPASVGKGLSAVGGSTHGLSVVLQVREPVSEDTIWCDCIMLMPADEMYMQVDMSRTAAAATTGGLMVTSLENQNTAVILDGNDAFEDIAILRSRGVWVQPGRKNRFWLLTESWDSGNSRYFLDRTSGATVEMTYTPRYLLLPSYEGGGGGGWA